MNIIHKLEQNQFVLQNDAGEIIGKIEYVPESKNILVAIHTWVSPSYGGQGYAGQLLDALVEYAFENQYTIRPVCSYVVHAFEKHPEKYKNVL